MSEENRDDPFDNPLYRGGDEPVGECSTSEQPVRDLKWVLVASPRTAEPRPGPYPAERGRT